MLLSEAVAFLSGHELWKLLIGGAWNIAAALPKHAHLEFFLRAFQPHNKLEMHSSKRINYGSFYLLSFGQGFAPEKFAQILSGMYIH